MITICKNINVHTNLCCSPLTNTTAAIITTSASNSRGSIILKGQLIHTPPTTSDPTSTSYTNANSTHDDSKPSDCLKALAYCKPRVPEDEGYPEPSLVDEP